ncbi:hypothetical protein DFQ27_003910 [Actinomortierella ambigua]|uniref:Uncharacterized protein n=1 Tax=Actinomortierella ambigua TaxID=1343610 RepID=A0A9P6Q3B7_9FUNG|nr:hypothetical protein DFQ27_003910 [Actinomortierella ambigua]
MADHGQTPRHPNAHWHINDPVDFAASGGNHSALISCPDRTLWMAGSDDDHQCLRPAKFGTGNTNTVQSDTAGTATAARATTSAATVEEAESLASSLQFHRVADLPFLQALDRQSVARGKVYRAANDGLCGSSVHSIRWCSVACGWAFTIAVAEVEEEKAGTASTKAPEMDICSVHSRHQIDRPQVMEKAVFAWGAGSFGELGLGPGVNKTGDRPERVLVGCLARTLSSTPSSLRYEIFKVRAGLRHVLALARDREQGGKTVLVGWGNNRHGQIGMLVEPPSTTTMAHNTKKKGSGLPDVHTKISEPALLYLAPMDASSAQYKPGVEIMDVACGQNHSLVLLSDGAVYSSGLNKHDFAISYRVSASGWFTFCQSYFVRLESQCSDE